MVRGPTRREVMVAAALASGATALPGQAAATTTDVCAEIEAAEAEIAELEAEIAELEAEIAELEAILDDVPGQTRALYEEMLALHRASRPPKYDDDIRSTARAVGEEIRESVVLIDVIGPGADGFATAWLVEDGYLLTNAHNVDSDPSEIACFSVDGEEFEGSIVGYVDGRTPDVAVLETTFDGTPLPTGSSRDLVAGDHLVQVGHPGDFGYWVISLGEFIEREDDHDLVASIPGLAGNSGSPIVTFDGDVVAMTSSGRPEELPLEPAADTPRTGLLAPREHTGAVPIETALEKLEEWT